MSLYLEHFGLREPAFRMTPQTDFFFSGANRGPTLDALIYAITQDEGIVKITGEVGSGKTMLCRMLLERLPDNVESLYLANPSLSRSEILGSIADELRIETQAGSNHSLARTLQDALLQRYADHKRVVILIDEAHAMPAESLEEIRLLSNLESNARKLLQIALFAQPEIEQRLAANEMRQLRERITQHFDLSPMNGGEVADYLEFRLRTAGYRGPNPFSERAIEQIARISQGLSRRINILADKSMLAAYSADTYQIDTREVQIARRDARFLPLQKMPPLNFRPLLWGISGGLAAAVLAMLLGFALWPGPHADSSAAAITHPIRENASATSLPVTGAIQEPTKAVSTSPESNKTIKSTNPSHQSNSFGPLTRAHMADFVAWIETTASERYFIQLLGSDADSTVEIEHYLSRARKLINPQDLRAYRSTLSGRDRVGVIYGDYPTRQAASVALRALPEEIRRAMPYPRQVAQLAP